jgi:hypothetical protein
MVDLEQGPADSTWSHVEAAIARMARAERALQAFREALLEELSEATDAETLGCMTVLGGVQASFVEAVRTARKAVALARSGDLAADELLASVHGPERVVKAELDALWPISLGAAGVFEVLFERDCTSREHSL